MITKVDESFETPRLSGSHQRMSRNKDPPYNLILAFIVLIGVGGALGVSSLDVKVSVIGTLLVTAAVLESALIVGGFALLNRRRRSPSTPETN